MLLNGFGALVLLAYGWYCLRSDVFYLPPRRGHDRSLHGIGCTFMVGFLVCVAILLLLPVLRAYLGPTHRLWCERAWWPVAVVGIGLFAAGLLSGLLARW